MKSESAGNVGTEENQDEEAAAVFKTVIQKDASEDGQSDEDAVGHLHEGGHECREAEAFDDYGAEITYTIDRQYVDILGIELE